MKSTEGTTQDDPLAMAMYAIGILPLNELLQKPNVTQNWYEADRSAAGDLKSLAQFRHNVKPSKCHFIVKENRPDSTIKVFEGTNITVIDGFRVFGSVIGTPSACDKYMESEIEKTATVTKIPISNS